MAEASLRKKCGRSIITSIGHGILIFCACEGVLGCTGSVGQRFILLLASHSQFTTHALGASPRSAGKKYRDAVRWKQAYPMSDEVGNLVVRDCKPEAFIDCDLVFSGLDSDVAGEIGQ